VALVARVAAEGVAGGGEGTAGFNDRIARGVAEGSSGERRAGGARAPGREQAGATPDRRRPSHTILEAVPPPRQSTVRIRTVNNPLVSPGR